MTDIAEQKCENCLFYRGDCRRFPPQLISTDVSSDYYMEDGHKVWETDREPYFAFPDVDKDDWCGEWRSEDASNKKQTFHERWT